MARQERTLLGIRPTLTSVSCGQGKASAGEARLADHPGVRAGDPFIEAVRSKRPAIIAAATSSHWGFGAIGLFINMPIDCSEQK
jgi:hypothetical protein